MIKFFTFFAIIILSFNALADECSKASTWLGFMSKKSLKESSSLWTEVQLRYDNNQTTMQQTLFRFGYLYSLDSKHEAGLILGYIQTGLQKEYRPTLQHIYAISQSNETALNVRSRLEARQVEDNPDFSMRYRANFRWQQTLSEKYSFVFWEEPFINLTDDDWTGNRTFERNRAFIGTRIHLTGTNLELGYMNQYIPRSNQSITEHILTAYLFY